MSASSPSPVTRLPTPRQLLTSLLTAISKIPPQQPPPLPITSDHETIDGLGSRTRIPTASTNPLKNISPSHKPLFTTLHVLFPSLLLPALDLLDRGLVTRLQLSVSSGKNKRERPLTHIRRPASSEDRGPGMPMAADAASTVPSPAVYVVRSAQKHPSAGTSRRGAGESSTGDAGLPRRYIVHTAPWNCTCAAFAFAAFPAARARSADERGGMSVMDEEEGLEDEGEGWEFGGMSFDGVGVGHRDGVECDEGKGDVPPCCKHLLACVLAERWAVGLGGYVNERMVSREEMAGIFADV